MNIVLLRDIITDITFDVITDIISSNPLNGDLRITAVGDERITADDNERIIAG